MGGSDWAFLVPAPVFGPKADDIYQRDDTWTQVSSAEGKKHGQKWSRVERAVETNCSVFLLKALTASRPVFEIFSFITYFFALVSHAFSSIRLITET